MADRLACAYNCSDEFLHVLQTWRQENDAKEEVEEAFKSFDVDNLGFLVPAGLEQVLNKHNESFTREECEQLVNLLGNSDGHIDYNTFARFMFENKD